MKAEAEAIPASPSAHRLARLTEDDAGGDVLFIAGEHSGDQHASRVARRLREVCPHWRLAAVGGRELERAGARLLYDLTRDAVVGLVEVLRNYGHFRNLFHALLDWVERHQPTVVVLVDYPGFNLRFADALRKRGISRKGGGNVAVYQYVSPQIWAWKAGRRFKMARSLDELGVIFPFETDCYGDTELPVHFVGHPFVRPNYANPLSHDPDGPILLLPGSRRQAVERIFPVMLKALERLRAGGEYRPAVCLYPDEAIHAVLEQCHGRFSEDSLDLSLRSVEHGVGAAAVLTSSGTMSLNCALAGIPGAIVYRAHPLTVWIGRRLVKVDFLGIANLVLRRELYPEHLQGAAVPETLAAELKQCLADTERRRRFAEGAKELRRILGADSSAPVAERLRALAEKS